MPTHIFRTEEHNVLDLTVWITNISDHINKTERSNKSNINDARHNENDIDVTIQNNEKQDVRNIDCNSTKHISRTDIVASIPEQCEFIIALLIRLSVRHNSRPEEDENSISVTLIVDGEHVLMILLSNHNREIHNENNARVLFPRVLLNHPDNNNKKKIIDINGKDNSNSNIHDINERRRCECFYPTTNALQQRKVYRATFIETYRHQRQGG